MLPEEALGVLRPPLLGELAAAGKGVQETASDAAPPRRTASLPVRLAPAVVRAASLPVRLAPAVVGTHMVQPLGPGSLK